MGRHVVDGKEWPQPKKIGASRRPDLPTKGQKLPTQTHDDLFFGPRVTTQSGLTRRPWEYVPLDATQQTTQGL